MNPETELLLIAFISGSATMLFILFPIWLNYDLNMNIKRLKDTAEAFNRGYDLARKQSELRPYSVLANTNPLP